MILKTFGNLVTSQNGVKNWEPNFSITTEKFLKKGAFCQEKSLIALAVAHTEMCPYCIDAYTVDGLQRGITKEEMMEAVHVGAAIKGGASLVHGVMMMNKVKNLKDNL